MPLEIQSTLLGPIEGKVATIEIVVSDSAEADMAVESLHIRTRIDVVADSYLPALQVAALERAKTIIEKTMQETREAWKDRK